MAQRSSIFITAAEARQNPIRDRAVHDEARGIESAILDAVKLGLFEVTVDNGTPMTNSQAPLSDVWTVNASTDQLYIPSHGFSTGDAVTVSSSVSLPAPLKSNSYYYVIYVDPDHIKLAASYSNAVVGRPVSIDISAGLASITVSENGSGYIQPPAVTVTGGGASVNGTARAYLASWGSLVSIINTTSGTGYVDQPTVQIVPQGSGAVAGDVTYTAVGISINDSGDDYRAGDVLTVLGGQGTSTTAVVTEVDGSGSIMSVSLSNPGAYTTLPSLVNASTSVLPGGGSGASVNLTMGIKEIAVDTGGLGYTSPPRIIISDASGVGAVAGCQITGGSITSVSITNPGYGYVGPTTVEFDSGSGASATASLVPTGVQSVVVVDDGGAGYTSTPSVTISAVGNGASAGTVTMKIVSCQVTSTGIGYSKDDMLLIAGGTASENAWIRVTSVTSAGSILTYSLESGGSYTALPNLLSNPVNGGTGNLAAFNLVAGVAEISVGSAGSGYAVPPVVSIGLPGNGGTSAIAVAVLSGGEVETFTITNAGYGYTTVPAVTVSNGSGASGEAILSPTTVSDIQVTSTGSGYSYANVTISGGGASIDATAIANIVGDAVASITIVDPGEGYTSTPLVTIDGDGDGAVGVAVLYPTSLAGVTVLTSGSGYNTPPSVLISGDATAAAVLQATGIASISVDDQGANYTSDPTIYLIPGPNQGTTPLSPVLTAVRGYSIASIAVVSTGAGYQSAPTVTVSVPQIDGGIQATATATIGAGLGTFALRPYPESYDYFKAWKGMPLSNEQLSRPYIERMDTIVSYFTNMGYTINRLTNPSNNSTLMWKVQW